MIVQLKLLIVLMGLCLSFPSTPLCAQSGKRRVELSWPTVPKAKSYQVELKRKINADVIKTPRKANSWKGRLDYGTHRLRVRSVDGRGVPGSWSDFTEFIVKPPIVKSLVPKSGETYIAAEGEDVKVNFFWKN